MEIAKKRMQTCCFTGHRHLQPEEQDIVVDAVRRFRA